MLIHSNGINKFPEKYIFCVPLLKLYQKLTGMQHQITAITLLQTRP